MAKADRYEDVEETQEQQKETPMAKGAVDPHAGLVKMAREDKIIHAHRTVVKEHEKNGWKLV